MMEGKDWLSFFVGAVIAAMGVLPLFNNFGVGPSWFAMEFLPLSIFAYIAAGAGFYLMVNSVIEITNSNAIGWFSFLIAILFLAVGVLQTLSNFGIGPSWFELSFISPIIYRVIFSIEGFFLMIAAFAMEM